MASILSLLGFPPPEHRDVVRFHFAKNFSYNTRITLSFLLMGIGIGLQVVFMNPLHGIPFLVVGIGLMLVKGYDSRARISSFNMDRNWQNVQIDKIHEIERLNKKIKRWDRDALDISNFLGVFCFILFSGIAFSVSFVLGKIAGEPAVTTILLVDTAIFIIPFWFSGMRFILKNTNLVIRVNIILKLFKIFEKLKKNGEIFRPALLLAKYKNNETIPLNARFSIEFPGSPQGFYGLQAQININLVQGKSYPYFYCVLAAKPGFGLGKFKDKVKLGKEIICEYQEDSKAEVLVIRQKTTKTSGYHTNIDRCKKILELALEAGRIICHQN